MSTPSMPFTIPFVNRHLQLIALARKWNCLPRPDFPPSNEPTSLRISDRTPKTSTLAAGKRPPIVGETTMVTCVTRRPQCVLTLPSQRHTVEQGSVPLVWRLGRLPEPQALAGCRRYS